MKKVIIILIAVGLLVIGGVLVAMAIAKAPRAELISRTEIFDNVINSFEIDVDTASLSFVKTSEDKVTIQIAEDEKEKYTEDDIIGLIKKELPYNSVEIKKRGSKGLKW